MLWIVRIAFWLQLVLGLGLSRLLFGAPRASFSERDFHMLLGVAAALLAIAFLRPRPGDPSRFDWIAAFFPLLPLTVGLYMRFGPLWGIGPGATVPFLVLHILLGLTAVGLVEASISRRRRRARLESPIGP
jgi:cytochrome b561